MQARLAQRSLQPALDVRPARPALDRSIDRDHGGQVVGLQRANHDRIDHSLAHRGLLVAMPAQARPHSDA
jgi:hypothetical protein